MCLRGMKASHTHQSTPRPSSRPRPSSHSDSLCWAWALWALLLSSSFRSGALGCFQTLRTPPYETYWLENQSSRFTGVCLAIRGFRWAFKLIRVTYEQWKLEMDYAQCMSNQLFEGISSSARSWSDMLPSSRIATATTNSALLVRRTRSRKFAVTKALYRRRVSSESRVHPPQNKKNHSGPHTDFDLIIPTKIEVTSRQSSDIFSLIPQLQEWYNALLTVSQLFISAISNMWNHKIMFCTRNYARNAFWRWIDGAPLRK